MDRNSEIVALQIALKDLGLYERGMDLEEMRKIQSAVNESIDESSSSFEEDLQASLLESERVANEIFQRSCEESLSSSVGSVNSNIVYMKESLSPPSSPDHPKFVDVVAEIHPEPLEKKLSEPKQGTQSNTIEIASGKRDGKNTRDKRPSIDFVSLDGICALLDELD